MSHLSNVLAIKMDFRSKRKTLGVIKFEILMSKYN